MLTFLILFVPVYIFGAEHIGTLAAKYDLLLGRYEIHGYGLILGDPEYYILDIYGIKYRHVMGCMVTDFDIDRINSYNKTMQKAIGTDLGIDVYKLLGWNSEESLQRNENGK